MNIGEMILMFRERCIKLYKDYERIIFPMIKFLLVLIMLLGINSSIGYMSLLNKAVVCMGIAFLAMFVSINWINVIFMLVITVHMVAFNPMIGAAVGVFFILLYNLYIRLFPKESVLIIITIIALKFQVGYAVPLIAALFGGFACLLPMTLGVVFSYLGNEIQMFMQGTVATQDNLINIIISLINQNVITDATMLATIGIFIITFTIVYIIRKQSIDYAPYIGITVGGVMSLLGFGIAILFLEIKIDVLLLVVMTILSIILAVICEFTSKVLHYSRSEVVQFEDEDNYYYVKVVPKVSTNINKKKVEQVYTTTTKENIISVDGEGF